MKTLDKYILKSFIQPFLATFLIILFVLVMQTLWLVFDNLAGKGISIEIILKFLWYTTLLMTPQALPIGVLLSSIMTLGNLSENYEFAATKSAGISLQRMVRPLVFLTILLSGLNFLFLNNVYPYAMLKQLNMRVNIKKKQPSIALVAGGFNTELPNFQIKFEEKYGEKDNLLKEVMIYDLSSKKGNNKIITAKKGEIISEEGSRYMTLILKDGRYFEHHINSGASLKERQKMPASYASFNEYTINIDISSLSKVDMGTEKYTRQYNMLSLSQLKDTIPDIKKSYDAFIVSRAKNLLSSVNIKDLHIRPDSLIDKQLSLNILDNFKLTEQKKILKNANSKIDRKLNNNKSNKKTLKTKRKHLNLYDIEFYNRVAFSLSCLLLFFIGAPLGSIIRKGGMGLPMILAISIYVLYFFTNTFGRNLAEESSITAITGSWLSLVLMLPLAIVLTVRASKDKGLFDFGNLLRPISNFIINFSKNKDFNIYDYNVPYSKKSSLYKEELINIERDQLIDIIKNYYQYGYSKEYRQVAIDVLAKNENIDVLKESGQLENHIYKNVSQKYREFKTILNINLVFWFFQFLFTIIILNEKGFLLIVISIILYIINIILLIVTYKSYQDLNVTMDNKLSNNTALFYIGGFTFFIIIYYLILQEIKEKIKTIT